MMHQENQPKSVFSPLRDYNHRRHFALTIYEAAIKSAAWTTLPDYHVGPTGLTKSDIKDKLERLRACCTTLEIHEHQDESLRIHTANFCGLPAICPLDAHRLQAKRVKLFAEPIEQAVKDGLIPYMVTFTVSSRPTLHEQITHLKKSLIRWRKLGQHGRPGEYGKVQAGFWSFETKRGEGGKWHAHAHALIFCAEPLDYRTYNAEKMHALSRKLGRELTREELLSVALDPGNFNGSPIAWSKASREWHAATGDSCDLEISPCYDPYTLDREKAAMHGAVEVLKYIHKGNHLTGDEIVEVLDQTAGLRLFNTVGTFRKLQKQAHDYRDSIAEEMKTRGPVTKIYWARWSETCGYSELSDTDRSLLDLDEIATELHKAALSEQGKQLGIYKRRRRQIRDRLHDLGQDYCAYLLNGSKADFRAHAAKIWNHYRHQLLAARYAAGSIAPPLDLPPEQIELFTAPPPEMALQEA